MVCKENSDCEKDFICVEGYCVREGTNPTEEEEEEDEEEKEKPVCEELLKETCGTEAPDLNEICSDEALEFCADGFALYAEKCEEETIPKEMIEETKEGVWNDLGSDIVDCCNEYKYMKEDLTSMLNCIKTKSCDECMEVYEKALEENSDSGDSGDDFGNTGNTGNTGDIGNTANEGDGTKASETPTTSGNSSSGCSTILI